MMMQGTQLEAAEGVTCPRCGGTILPPSIGGAKRGTCHCRKNVTTTQEEQMSKKTKRDHGTAEDPKAVTYTLPEPAAEAPKAEAKVAKVAKPIAYEPSGEIRSVKAGSKLSVLIDRLGQEGGVTLAELAEALSASGSKVDVAGVRSWISYDLRRVGLGCRQDGDRLFLVGTPLPHKVAEPKKAQEPKLEGVTEPKQKKAAMTAARSKKAAKS